MPETRKEEEKKAFNIQEFLRDYLFPTLSIVILILMVSLVMLPTINNISANTEMNRVREKELADLKAFSAKLIEISENQGNLLNNNIVLDKYLPKDSRLSLFIDDINLMAESVGFESTTLEGSEQIQKEALEAGQEESKEPRPHRVFATFNYEGDFDAVYKLFEELNNFRGLLTVQSVTFTKGNTDWEVEINVASYNLPQEVLDAVVLNQIQKRSVKLLPVVDETLLELIKARVEE